ncbi:flagellar assembly protein H [Sulfurimicrobium lacus]|uniref:Flagellar assembly protein FliH n=1 Tax=Sulfurimicrobium lacus TaxID=2715678 RepID=A0A6F8VAK1_9PROT|nr:flagellar assembly protein FliH [Sulfurimicrobium lacus]BCB26171.1 flagellar assembly protein H [Sulfurimicrobium lacus]
MSNIVPKEQLSAYQRWEMDAFDKAHVELPTAESIQQIQQQAHQEGYQEGVQQGREQGYREGREQALQEAQRISRLLVQVNETLQRLDQELAQQVLELVLGLARQMLRQALSIHPELVLPVVQEAINSLPQANQQPQLIVHPQDAALLRSHLEAELAHGHWRVVEDAQITPGGCRLETAQSEIDATLENRWKRVLESLGQSGDWLGPLSPK